MVLQVRNDAEFTNEKYEHEGQTHLPERLKLVFESEYPLVCSKQ